MCPLQIYILELSVGPAGTRKHVLYVCNSLDEVVTYLKDDLTSSPVSLSVRDEQTIRLYICPVSMRHDGCYDFYASSEPVDLLPYITYHDELNSEVKVTIDTEKFPTISPNFQFRLEDNEHAKFVFACDPDSGQCRCDVRHGMNKF
jgi:hypothetical protein